MGNKEEIRLGWWGGQGEARERRGAARDISAGYDRVMEKSRTLFGFVLNASGKLRARLGLDAG